MRGCSAPHSQRERRRHKRLRPQPGVRPRYPDAAYRWTVMAVLQRSGPMLPWAPKRNMQPLKRHIIHVSFPWITPCETSGSHPIETPPMRVANTGSSCNLYEWLQLPLCGLWMRKNSVQDRPCLGPPEVRIRAPVFLFKLFRGTLPTKKETVKGQGDLGTYPNGYPKHVQFSWQRGSAPQFLSALANKKEPNLPNFWFTTKMVQTQTKA